MRAVSPPSVEQLLIDIAKTLPDGGISTLPSLLDQLGVACDQQDTSVFAELSHLQGLPEIAEPLDCYVQKHYFPTGQKYRNITPRLKELFAGDWIRPYQYIAAFGISGLTTADFNTALVALKSTAECDAAYDQLRKVRAQREWSVCNNRWSTADVLLALEHFQGFRTTRAQLRKSKGKRRRKTDAHAIQAQPDTPRAQSSAYQHPATPHSQHRLPSPTPVQSSPGSGGDHLNPCDDRTRHTESRNLAEQPEYSFGPNGDDGDFGFGGDDGDDTHEEVHHPAGQTETLLDDSSSRLSIEHPRRVPFSLPDASVLDAAFELSQVSFSSALSGTWDYLNHQTPSPHAHTITVNTEIMSKRAATVPPLGSGRATKGRKLLDTPDPSRSLGASNHISIPGETGVLTTLQLGQAVEFLAKPNAQLGAVFLRAFFMLVTATSNELASDVAFDPASGQSSVEAPTPDTWHFVPPGHITFNPPNEDNRHTLLPLTPYTKARGHRYLLVPVFFTGSDCWALGCLDTKRLTAEVFHPADNANDESRSHQVKSAIQAFINSCDHLESPEGWQTFIIQPQIMGDRTDSAILCTIVALQYSCNDTWDFVDSRFWRRALLSGFRNLVSPDSNGVTDSNGETPDAPIEISCDTEAAALMQELLGLAGRMEAAEEDVYSLQALDVVVTRMQLNGDEATLAKEVEEAETVVRQLQSWRPSCVTSVQEVTSEAQDRLRQARLATTAWRLWSGLDKFRSQTTSDLRTDSKRGEELKKSLMQYYFTKMQAVGLVNLPVPSKVRDERRSAI